MKHLSLFVAIALLAAACESKKGESTPPDSTRVASDPASPSDAPRRVAVSVTGSGYEPDRIDARAGEALTLAFKRTSEEGCGDEVVFPGRDLRRALPIDQEVEVELTPKKDETIAFTCGMGMYRGSVVASTR
ncbi:MAG: cupredoxin domain-containing protein [Deltaproteobacteria bacterium]|jgi:plastocyanin domain-containing protein